ncbi:MAG TPA: hypothetical protein VFO63_02435 [Blastocatellia bacterium]|nr:hypothetical protein [Blastocatellia bacterium]
MGGRIGFSAAILDKADGGDKESLRISRDKKMKLGVVNSLLAGAVRKIG